MQFKLLDAGSGSSLSVPVDDKTFSISVSTFEQCGDFATVIVHDPYTDEFVFSNGIYESHGHRLMFRWDMEYDYNRDNWVHNHTLLVDVL